MKLELRRALGNFWGRVFWTGNSKDKGSAMGKNLCEQGAERRPSRLEQTSKGESGGDEPQLFGVSSRVGVLFYVPTES